MLMLVLMLMMLIYDDNDDKRNAGAVLSKVRRDPKQESSRSTFLPRSSENHPSDDENNENDHWLPENHRSDDDYNDHLYVDSFLDPQFHGNDDFGNSVSKV